MILYCTHTLHHIIISQGELFEQFSLHHNLVTTPLEHYWCALPGNMMSTEPCRLRCTVGLIAALAREDSAPPPPPPPPLPASARSLRVVMLAVRSFDGRSSA